MFWGLEGWGGIIAATWAIVYTWVLFYPSPPSPSHPHPLSLTQEEVQELLVPLVMDPDTKMDVACAAALSLGLVFASSCREECVSAILQALMLRTELELTEACAKHMCLGLGLLFLGKQDLVEGSLEVCSVWGGYCCCLCLCLCVCVCDVVDGRCCFFCVCGVCIDCIRFLYFPNTTATTQHLHNTHTHLHNTHTPTHTTQVAKTVNPRISEFAQVVLESCAYAGTGDVLKIQQLLALCGQHITQEEDPQPWQVV